MCPLLFLAFPLGLVGLIGLLFRIEPAFDERVSGHRVNQAKPVGAEFDSAVPSRHHHDHVPHVHQLHEMEQSASGGRLAVVVGVLDRGRRARRGVFALYPPRRDVVRGARDFLVRREEVGDGVCGVRERGDTARPRDERGLVDCQGFREDPCRRGDGRRGCVLSQVVMFAFTMMSSCSGSGGRGCGRSGRPVRNICGVIFSRAMMLVLCVILLEQRRGFFQKIK